MTNKKSRMAALAAVLLVIVLLLALCIRATVSKDEPHRFEKLSAEQAKCAGLVQEVYADAEIIDAWIDTYSGYIYVELSEDGKAVVTQLIDQNGDRAKIGGYDD